MGSHTLGGQRRQGHLRFGLLGASLLVGLLGSGGLIWKGTTSAFTATTTNGSNSWTAGSVAITDDDTSTAMFTATNLKPGDTGTKCIRVDYDGTVAANVRLYVSASSDADTLAQYVNIKIEEGTAASGGTFANCTGFIANSTLVDTALSTITAARTQHSNGLSTWAPTLSTEYRVYRFTYTLNASTPDAKQGKTTSATFAWEAQST